MERLSLKNPNYWIYKTIDLEAKALADNIFNLDLKFVPIRLERRKIYRYFRFLIKQISFNHVKRLAKKMILFFIKQPTASKLHFWYFINQNKQFFREISNRKHTQTPYQHWLKRIFVTIIKLFTKKQKW